MTRKPDATPAHAATEGSPSAAPLLASGDPLESGSASIRVDVLGSKGKRELRVRLVRYGLGEGSEPSGAKWNVPKTPEVFASVQKTFGGARVHWHKAPDGTFEHTEKYGFAKVLTDWAGTPHDAGYVKDIVDEADGIYASVPIDADVPDAIFASLAAGDLGLSVECCADRRPRIEGGRAIVDLVGFSHYPNKQASVAIVSSPGLGGRSLGLAASIAKHLTPPLAASTRRSTPMTLEQARALLASATATAEEKADAQKVVDAAELAASVAAAKKAQKDAEEALAAIRVSARTSELDTTLLASKLPEASRNVIRDLLLPRIKAGEELKLETVTAEIDRQRGILNASATGNGSGTVLVGAGPREKLGLGLERILMGDAPAYAQQRFADLAPGHKSKLIAASARGQVLASREQAAGIGYSDRPWSFRRLFRDTTGVEIEDVFRATGRQRHELAASINVAQFGDVFENVLNIAGFAYQENPEWGAWRKLVKIVPFSGTLKQERVATGGYGDLPDVAEGENYPAATSPTDQGHGYTPKKAGHTDDWTVEAMLNDRIGALRNLIQKMALGADRKKYKYVFNQITVAGMPTMDYDSVKLCHASSHGANLLSSALTATSLAAAREAMVNQVDFSNSEKLGLQPRFLLVRQSLEKTAFDLLKPLAQEPGGSTDDNEWLRRMNLETIVVRHWPTAAMGAVDDWAVVADPNNGQVDTFEMGFEGGREMAEIFVQDLSNVGSMFERDAVTVAVKQPYFGGSPLRHEPFVISDV